MAHSPVVMFETNESVSEVLDEVLSFFGVEHVSHLVPPAKAWNLGYFLRILCEHRPELVITSFRHIGRQVLAAAKASRPQPEIWIFTSYDEETLLAQGAFFLADRVFEKPWGVKRIGREAHEFLTAALRGST